MDREDYDALNLRERGEFLRREIGALRSEYTGGRKACVGNFSAWMKERCGYDQEGGEHGNPDSP